MYGFPIGTEARQMLLGGLDMIDLTLTRLTEIDAFVAADQRRRPWAYLK
jgi:3-isopropylmalate/(R)-2-methylmalate dehydratase small subunit